MQHPFLKLLPGPETLGARLALSLLVIVLLSLVLTLLTLLQIAKLTPADLEHTFIWVVLIVALLLVGASWLFWCLISHEVLRPLEQMRQSLQQEPRATAGLGHMAATMRELRDTVERTQAELDKSTINLRLVEKLAMVGKLAAGVAHSVRNPLTAIKLRLFSLERSLALGPRQQEDFSVIAGAIRHLDSVVSNFLEFSRRPQIRLQAVTLSAVVDGTLKLLENRIASFPIRLNLHRIPLPPIQADPDQLHEALLNILLNACEAMEYSGDLSMEEFLYTTDDNTAYACVRVRDSGPGIPADNLKNIFTPFFSTKEQGTGLGLPIAKGILEEHGGDLLVESVPGSGCTFTLLLPLA